MVVTVAVEAMAGVGLAKVAKAAEVADSEGGLRRIGELVTAVKSAHCAESSPAET